MRESERRIAMQAALVARLESEGRGTRRALELLVIFQGALGIAREHLRRDNPPFTRQLLQCAAHTAALGWADLDAATVIRLELKGLGSELKRIPQRVAGIEDIEQLAFYVAVISAHNGACILHVSPESAIGGSLAAAHNGGLITLDTDARSIHLHVDDAEIASRPKPWTSPRDYPRGYYRMFVQHIWQAHEGCDFDYLEGANGIPESEIHQLSRS